MSWFSRWWRHRGYRHTDTTDEAREVLDRVDRREAAVARLGAELAEIREANHFSQMVNAAVRGRARRA